MGNLAGDDLAAMRAAHPSWEIGRSESGLMWEAITKPTPRTERVILAPTLHELAAKLDAVDPPP
jgi:hypothetical protein